MSRPPAERVAQADQRRVTAADNRPSTPPVEATVAAPIRAPSPGIAGPPLTPAPKCPHGPILLVVPQQNYWGPDVENIRRAAAKCGAKIRFASSALTPPTPSPAGPAPQPLPVDLLLSEARAQDYSVIVFSGAYPSESLEHVGDPDYAQAARKVIDDFLAAKKPVASICMGSRVLADLGFLAGRRAARCPYQPKTAEYEAKARWTDQPVESDGLLVTGKDQRTADLLLQELRGKLR